MLNGLILASLPKNCNPAAVVPITNSAPSVPILPTAAPSL
jgi:hypothetical protein